MANRISVLIDVAVDGATSQLGKFRKAMGDAEGSAGKFKAGASSAFSSIQASAGALALGAGAALVGFGVKAVGAFQDLALEAGKLSEALGLPVEDASRLIEVAGDVGIEVGSLESTLGKMNVTAGKTPGAFAAIGAEIVKNKDGTTNVNETFLATIDALNGIPDATQRAAAAQKIFGKGWKDIAELVGQGSDEIRKSLAAVSDAKVIDESEVAKARDMREAMNNLRDAVHDVSLVVGEALVPILADAGELLIKLKGALTSASNNGVAEFGSKLGAFNNIFKVTNDLWDKGGGNLVKMATGFESAKEATTVYGTAQDLVNESITKALVVKELTDATAAAEQATQDHTDAILENNRGLTDAYMKATDVTYAFKELRGTLSDREAYLNLKQDLADLATNFLEGKMSAGEYELAQIGLTNKLISYAEAIGTIPPAKVTDIQALIDAGKLGEAAAELEKLAAPRTATINIVTRNGTTDQRGRQAAGDLNTDAGMFKVGEQGPEEVYLPKGSRVRPTSAVNARSGSSGQPSMMSSGAGTTIILTVNGILDGNQGGRVIVDSLKKFYNNGGQPP